MYDTSKEVQESSKRPRALSPENELFLVLVRLRLGLIEPDLIDRFEISQSTTTS